MIIDKFIVHMLDINLDKPMLADFIGKDYSDVDKFLKKLITKCQKHDETNMLKSLYKIVVKIFLKMKIILQMRVNK